ncbi:MAG: hypothetical protein E3K32_07275 [wastewater metagenome]|nr:hypothetical protein [Candidatus Loosdrechtia aerotolerans]
MNKQVSIAFVCCILSQPLFYPYQKAFSQSGKNTPGLTINMNNHPDPAYITFQEVFGQFDNNAERLYQRYGIFALEFLKEYGIEGLVLLEKYGKEMAGLYPLLDLRDILRLYKNPENMTDNLQIFSRKTIAGFYKTFGDGGIQYIANDPENFFLINGDKDTGTELINLAKEKGDIVFPLARKHGIAFAKLYDREVLNIVIKFQEDGLLALKEYGEKAKLLFSLFINDDTFYHVIKTYGHKQTIPVIYLFYENKDFNSQVYQYLVTTNAYKWLSGWWCDADFSSSDAQSDSVIRYENARRAVDLIFELGNDFIDRFEILDINNVREEAVTTITNKLRNFFLSDIEKVSRKRIRHEDITFQDKLFAGLDILGFIPVGAGVSKVAKLAAKGTQLAKTTKGFKGIIHLSDDLVTRYGDDVVPFVARHGDEGIRVLKATDGKILTLSQKYGDVMIRYMKKYGTGAGTVIEKYGEELLQLAQQYGDDVIKYTMLYGDDGFRIIQKHGRDIVLLSSVYGDDVIKLSALHGDDIIKYVSKYGSNGIYVIKKYGNDVLSLAKIHGDDVIRYVSIYGDDGLKLASKGKIGLRIMQFMPMGAFSKSIKLIKYGLIAAVLFTIVTNPLAFLIGLVSALSWLLNMNPLIVIVLLGLVISFFLIRFLRKYKIVLKPLSLLLRIIRSSEKTKKHQEPRRNRKTEQT